MCITVPIHADNTVGTRTSPMDADLLFSINPGSPEPIYRQLVEQLRRRIASGQLVAGEEIPSVRELAQALAVNPMTVSKAFGLMEAEGLVERRRGLPMVVAAQHQKAMKTRGRVELLRPALEKAAAEARQLELPPDQVLALFKALLEDQGEIQ
jgi:GntR family transcriptional regulator